MRKSCPLEHQEQAALIQWLNLLPALRQYVIKIHNEGERTQGQTWHLKKQGLCPGASDLFIAYPVADRHGFWLECKRNMSYSRSCRDGAVWRRQEAFQERMRAVGYEAVTCYGWEHGKRMIESYLSNGRAVPDITDTVSLP